MRLVIRVRDETTKRYRRVDAYDYGTFLRDSEHLPQQINGVPVVLDSVFAEFQSVLLSFSPAWNRKKPKA